MAQNRKINTGSLPSVAEYLKTGETFTEQSVALCSLRTPTVRIPPAIRAQMRALPRLLTFWNQNRSTYTALIEASQQQGSKSRAAGV